MQSQPPPPGPAAAPGSGPVHNPPPVPQLPPQMFTTAASLLDLTDKKLLVTLRDGRKVLGILRSWDQFGNLVLQNTVERVFAGNLYTDMPRGIYLVRGENVTIMGEIDLDRDEFVPAEYALGSHEQVFALRKEEERRRAEREKTRVRRLRELGFEGAGEGEAIVL